METRTYSEPSDDILLNYASILCTGIDDYKRRSRRIEAAVEMICGGPDAGFLCDGAVSLNRDMRWCCVIREAGRTGGGKKRVFVLPDSSLFSPEALLQLFGGGSLRLFVSAEDVDHFARRLLAILDGAGKRCRAGVSRHYPASQAVTAFFEAESAAHIAGLLEYGEHICYYHDLGIYRLLNYPENSWPINQMLGEMDELFKSDGRGKTDVLAMTIRTLCQMQIPLSEDRGQAVYTSTRSDTGLS